MLNFLQGCWANTISIYYVPLSEGLGVSITMVSLYSTIQCLAAAAFMPFVAKATAKYDTRITVTVAVLLIAAGMFINASLQSVYVLWLSGIITAGACCLITFMLNPIVIGKWFCRRQATFLGACMFAQGVGGSIFASLGSTIIQNYGWRMSYVFLAVMVLAAGLPAGLILIRKTPEEMGQLPVGLSKAPSTAGGKNQEAADTLGMDARKARRTKVFAILTAMLSLWSFANCFNFFINSYAYSIGYTAVAAGVVASAMLLGQTAGSIGNGFTCDRSVKGTVVFGSCIVVVGYLLMLAGSGSVLLLTISAFLVGYTYSGFSVVGPTVLQEVFGRKDFAAIYGTVSTIGMFIAAFSFTIWSVISDKIGYHVSMILCIVIYCIVLIGFLVALSLKKSIRDQWEMNREEGKQ